MKKSIMQLFIWVQGLRRNGFFVLGRVCITKGWSAGNVVFPLLSGQVAFMGGVVTGNPPISQEFSVSLRRQFTLNGEIFNCVQSLIDDFVWD